MKFVSCILLIFLTVSYSCVERTEKDSQIINYKIDSLSIKIDSTVLSSYYVHSYNDSLDSFVGFNGLIHSLDYFDLKNCKFNRQVKLSKEGKDGVGNIYGICYFSPDSIFISENGFIKLLNRNGAVIKKYNLLLLSDFNKIYGNITSNQYVRLQYMPDRKSLLLFCVHNDLGNLTKPILFELNIIKNLLEPLPIYFSEYYKKNNGNLGFLAHINAEVINSDEIVYNYLYSSKLYKYSSETKKSNEIVRHIDDEFSNPLPPDAGQSNDKWEYHAIENPHFFQVLKDSYRKKYYQFIWQPIEYKRSDGKYNSFMEKRLMLIIMNEKFNVEREILLQDLTYMPFTWFVSRRGLMISNTHPKNLQNDEKKLTFHVIDVD